MLHKLNIMIKLNDYFVRISPNITVRFGQDSNGMHWAEIKEDGSVVSATTKLTSFEIQEWIYEQTF